MQMQNEYDIIEDDIVEYEEIEQEIKKPENKEPNNQKKEKSKNQLKEDISFWEKRSSTIYTIVLSLVSILPLYFMYYLYWINDYYMSDHMKGMNIYSSHSGATNAVSLLCFFACLFLIINIIKENKYPTKIEKYLQDKIKKIPEIKINSKLYSFFIVSIPILLQYIMIKIIVISALATSLVFEYDHHTFEKLDHYGYDASGDIISLIIATFAVMLILKPKEKINKTIIAGGILLPIIISTLSYFIAPLTSLNVFEPYLMTEIMTTITDVSYWIGTVFVFITIVSMFNIVCYYLGKDSTQMTIDLTKGFIFSKLLSVIMFALVLSSKPVEYFEADLNQRTVVIEGVEYNYKASLLQTDKYDDLELTEYLIEGYDGHSLHNTNTYFDYLFSDAYKGNKEKAYKLYSKVFLENAKHQEKTKELKIAALNDGMNLSESVPVIIGIIHHEAMPLDKFKSIYENILEGNYQQAIDDYVKNVVNNEEEIISTITGESMKELIGGESFKTMIASIIQNGYATIDYNEINNQERIDELKKLIESEIYKGTKSTDEEIENLYKIFKIN